MKKKGKSDANAHHQDDFEVVYEFEAGLEEELTGVYWLLLNGQEENKENLTVRINNDIIR